jgi:hypothetical protein
MDKYIAWKFINVDGDVISLSVLKIDADHIYSSSINWMEANPKILAVHNKKRLVGALSENEYYVDDIMPTDIFDSKNLAERNLVEFVYTTNSPFLKEKSLE